MPAMSIIVMSDFLLSYFGKADAFLAVSYGKSLWVGDVFTSCSSVYPASSHPWVIAFFQVDELLEGVDPVIPEFDGSTEWRYWFEDAGVAAIFGTKSMLRCFSVQSLCSVLNVLGCIAACQYDFVCNGLPSVGYDARQDGSKDPCCSGILMQISLW